MIIEDFIRYATVIGRRGGTLQRLWLNVWGPRTDGGAFVDPETTVIARINPQPVQDVDSDGLKEIVVSLFNVTGDGQWHVRVLDPLTGATKYDLPGRFLTGLRDADGDGVSEAFCTAVERGPRIPYPATISVVGFRPGGTAERWSLAEAAFVSCNLGAFPSHVNSGASLGDETVLCDPVRRRGW